MIVSNKSLKSPNREISPASDETQSSVNTNVSIKSSKKQVENQSKPIQSTMNVNAPTFVMNVNAKAWTPNFKV